MVDRMVINDVGPRDGLQNQPKILTPDERIQLITALVNAGLDHIEVGSFVSPKAVPAMAGTDRVLAGLPKGLDCTVLIPNMKGYELAQAAGVKSVAMVLYASEAMAQKNVRMSQPQVEEVTREILQCAKRDGIKVLAYIAVAFGCPFDGEVKPASVERITAKFLELDVDEVVLADTIGAAHPGQVRALTQSLVLAHGNRRLGGHFHDTRAMGLANVFAALESGIRKFDASIGGLGGCPFAPGASGNVATEDVVMMLEQMGCSTGIDLAGLMQASQLAAELTGNAPGGRAKKWLQRQFNRERA